MLLSYDPTPTAQRDRCTPGERLIAVAVGGDMIGIGGSEACFYAVKPKGTPGSVRIEHLRGGVAISSSGILKWPDDADAGEARACHTFGGVRPGDVVVLSCAQEIKRAFGIGLVVRRQTGG